MGEGNRQQFSCSTETNEKRSAKRRKVEELFTCNKCKRLYKQKKRYEQQIESCAVNLMEGDTIQRALRMAHTMFYYENEVKGFTRHQFHPPLAKVAFDLERDCRVIKRGWGRRPKRGQALGENTTV